jgi:hypothetical protein
MSNLANLRYLKPVGGLMPVSLQIGVKGGASKIWEGALVSSVISTGMAVRAGTSGSGHAMGIAKATVDNSAGSDGNKSIDLLQGAFWLVNHGTDTVTVADVGKPCFISDDQTVRKTSDSGACALAGLVLAVDSVEGVLVHVSAVMNAALESSQAEYGCISLSLHDFREVNSSSDEGNIAANGGLLASDTTPIMRGDANESQEISWAAGNADIISAQKALPPDFDGTQDVLVELFVYTDNAGGGGIDAATFTVETSWDAAALVSDTATDGTPATTMHKITATIDKADIPDSASVLSLDLTPAAHANDPTQLVGARILYRRKPYTLA